MLYLFLYFKCCHGKRCIRTIAPLDINSHRKQLATIKSDSIQPKMDRFYDGPLFNLIKYFTKILGQWPYQDEKTKLFRGIILTEVSYYSVFSLVIVDIEYLCNAKRIV